MKDNCLYLFIQKCDDKSQDKNINYIEDKYN